MTLGLLAQDIPLNTVGASEAQRPWTQNVIGVAIRAMSRVAPAAYLIGKAQRFREASRAARPTSARDRSTSATVRRGCALVACLAGAAVLLGWATDCMALTQLLPGLTAMNPMTATSLLIGGLILALHDRLAPRLLWTLGMTIAAIGAAKLLQLLLGLSLGADQLLFSARLDHGLGVPPNRMAPNTAFALVAMGAALSLSKARARGGVLASQWLALLVMAITLFALIGYVLNLAILYEVRRSNPMALHTAIALILIAIGTISANPEVGLVRVIGDEGPARQLSRVVLPLVVLVPVLVGVARLLGEKLGYYGTEHGVALQVFANVLVTFTLLMSSILALHRSDGQRRLRELSIKRSQAQYRLAEKMGHVGHWRLDLLTGSLACSEEFRTICGLERDAQLSSDVALASHHPDDADMHRDCLERAASSGEGWDGRRRIVRPDGSLRYIRSHGTSEVDESGRIVSLFGVFVDSTELELSRRQAEEATASKAAFLANMSHEIRTPLNSIIGFTDLMLDDLTLRPELKRQLGLVRTSGAALQTVVNDILDFSKMEAGKIELDNRSFDLEDLIDDTLSIIRGSAEAKGLTLQLRVDDDLQGYVVGDPARLRQIILNLLGNAVKFTACGTVALQVHRLTGEDGASVLFSIADTGPGVAPDKRNRLFQQFSQADSSICREHGGTGLGLAICKSLATLMDGRIGFRPRPDGGAEFWFTVALPATNALPSRSRDKDTLAGASSARILLVEDLEINQELATTILTRAGHRVEIANDGHEALAAVQQHDYDLVLMDIQMPRMDGVTATRLIRLLPGKAKSVPIVAMSANVLADQVRTFLDAGMNDHVGKPIDRAKLYAVVNRSVNTGRQPLAREGDAQAAGDFELRVFQSTAGLLSQVRLRTHIDSLQQQLEAITGKLCEPSETGALAHKLISQAGLLGFTQVVALCQEIEIVCANGSPIDGLLERLRAAASTAGKVLESLTIGDYAGDTAFDPASWNSKMCAASG